MILALVITLSLGTIEIRQEGAFATDAECRAHMLRRLQHLDIRRGNSVIACLSQSQFDNGLRAMFGGQS